MNPFQERADARSPGSSRNLRRHCPDFNRSHRCFFGFRALNAADLFLPETTDSEAEPEISYELKAVVRLDHTNAKIFAILLKRYLKDYEKDIGEIILPHHFVEVIDMAADEW